MLRNLGPMELLLLLAILLLLMGPDRVGRLGPELGKAIRGFREGLSGESTARTTTEREDEA